MTKQDLFMHKLKEIGGEATTKEMSEAMDEDYPNIKSLAQHLERRGLIKMDQIPLDYFPYRMSKFKIKEKKKKWQSEQN